MSVNIDLDRLPGPAQKILGPNAPAPAKLMAAGGVVPGLKPGDIATVVAALTGDSDAKVAAKARQTIGNLPPPILTGALGAELQPAVIELLADSYSSDADVVSKLLRMPEIGGDALVLLAERADERIGELVATNEQLLLAHPIVIEKLYMNKRVRMSTADRILELAVRNGLELSIPAFKEAAAAIQNALVPEATQELTYEDQLFKEVDQIASETKIDTEKEDTHDLDEEGEEKVKEVFKPLYARIADMSVTEKIRCATLGESAARLLLIRDTNRLVAAAAAQSPLMNENDAARVSASRQVSEDVLRIIARNRDFTRNYQVKLNLVMNPRTPFTFSSRLVPHLRENDLRTLSKSKNVPHAIRQAVRQQMARKQGRRS